VTYQRTKLRCPVCDIPVSLLICPDAVECEDEEGCIVRFHPWCYDQALQEESA
jgi:hypothetical protein